ncbi:peptidylprolyl isomerase [Desulfoplanes formicivorans]|uniref:PpiC domain-containing protein n=1 Tax=Desulfoplanes formicivorans TaxID=1592317 RepID=A0A194AL96_9BACT|nr:peptidylprolyl isomerase [Desulfoplanes formicivorans]GAU09449.1 hypothetical protein DPF_2175 [Desulfoplanes formicivorans]
MIPRSRVLSFPGSSLVTGVLLALSVVVLAGCSSEPAPTGIVARVNGEPIFFSQVRAAHDLHYMTWSSNNEFDVRSLQHEYGTVLADLILQRLIAQTLKAEHLAVSDEDVAREEARIRGDYPDDAAFEQTLIEEYIDQDQWRDRLRSRLNMQTFVSRFLRPRVTVTYEDALAYYKDHGAEFVTPERFVFTVFKGTDRDVVRHAVTSYRKDSNGTRNNPPQGVSIHEMDAFEQALAKSWYDSLSQLAPGEVGRPIVSQNVVTMLLLHRRVPRSFLSPSAAYPLVEQQLVAQGLQDAFARWMQNVLATANIEITGLLRANASGTPLESEDSEEE